jgi:WD40 repeat protein
MTNASDFSDVFISYRRSDVEFTKRLVASLKDVGKEVWIDWEDIPPGSTGFSDDIKRGLEGADAFICVLSPSYLESSYCVELELAYAVQLNKKIIPIILEKFPDDATPQGVGHINWVYFTPHAGQTNAYEEALPRVLDALDTDLEHARAHKRILFRALEWDNNQRNNSFLLTGAEIEDAEAWLAQASDKAPLPLDLHRAYIAESRKQANRRQQRLLAGVSVALVIALGLAALSFLLYEQAEANRVVADENASTAIAAQGTSEANRVVADENASTAIAAQSTAQAQADEANALANALLAVDLLDDNPFLSYRLVIEALRAVPSPDIFIRRTAHNILLDTGALWGIYPLYDGIIVQAVDESGRYALVNALNDNHALIKDGQIGLYDLVENEPVRILNIVDDGLFDGRIQQDLVAYTVTDEISTSTIALQRLDDEAPFGQITLDILAEIYEDDSLLDETFTITEFVLSPDAQYVAIGYQEGFDALYEGTLVINIADQSVAHHIELIGTGYAFSDDNVWLAIGTNDNNIAVYDLETNEKINNINLTLMTSDITGLDFSPDGETLAIGGEVPSVLLWNVPQDRARARYGGHEDVVTAVHFNHDGTRLLSGGIDRQVLLWDTNQGRQIDNYGERSDALRDVGFIADSEYIYTLGEADNAIVWQANRESALIHLEQYAGFGVAFSDDDTMLYYADVLDDVHIMSHDLATGERTSLAVMEDDLPSIALVPYADGTRALYTAYDYSFGIHTYPVVIDLTTGEYLAELDTELAITEVIVSDDGSRAVLLAGFEGMALWDLTSNTSLFETNDIVVGADFLPESQTALGIFSPDLETQVIMFFSAEGDVVRELTLPNDIGAISSLAVHPEDEEILVGNSDGMIYRLDISADVGESIQILSTYQEHSDTIIKLLFHPDGKTFLSAGIDESIYLWDVGSEAVLRAFSTNGAFTGAGFSSDGRLLAVNTLGEQLIVWRLFTDDELISQAYASLQINELTCTQRVDYRIDPLCKDDGSLPATPTVEAIVPLDVAPLYATAEYNKDGERLYPDEPLTGVSD